MSRPRIEPQPGPQRAFLESPADVAIYGGGAGGGKTFGILLDPLRHYGNPLFGAVMFRRTTRQVRNEGGLWDEGSLLYGALHAIPKISELEFSFPSGMRVQFAHLEHEKNVLDWQGSQVPGLYFDELTHFTASQFWYMFSRNRSVSGVRPYVRATCNPDADSWVRKLIDWWIDPDTGYPIPERSGKLRWFVRINDQLHWADSAEELIAQFGVDSTPKSLTFIPAKLSDNQILMQKDPAYRANLDALPLIERMRLRDGNWNVKPTPGMYFRRQWWDIVDALPLAVKSVRYWDRAATEATSKNPDPDYTVGLKLIRDQSGIFYVADILRMRESPHRVEQAIVNIARQDGLKTTIYLEQDPGQAGVMEVKHYARLLAGYDVHFNKVRTDKVSRARGISAQVEAGNVKLLRAPWNEDLIRESSQFPEGKHDDMVDALSGAFNMMVLGGVGVLTSDMAESDGLEQTEVTEDQVDW